VFAQEYIAAVSSGDPRQIEALLNSKSRACITPETLALFDWEWQRKLRRGTPEPHVVTVSAYTARLAAGTEQSEYPVAPTHQLQIDFGEAPNVQATILSLAMEDGRWRTVEPCPDGQGSE